MRTRTYAYYSNSHWDIRAGRQIITWGVADALRLTDIISPMDYTEFLAQDYDDIRIPVGALRLRYSREKWSLEAVAVPINSFFELPTDEENPWSEVWLKLKYSFCFFLIFNMSAIKLQNILVTFGM